MTLPALTGLRFFLALAVYVSHVAPPAGAGPMTVTVMAAGYYGVTFFFVLSGFVLALGYWDRLGGGLWDFAVARFARVYPLYILVLLIVATRDGPRPDLLLHVAAIQPWHPSLDVAFGYNGPGWSIGVEFFLYALLPFLIPAVAWVERRSGLTFLVVATIGVMFGIAALFTVSGRADLPGADPESAHRWVYRTPLLRVGDFLLGIIAARLYVRWRSGTRAWSPVVYGAVVATILLAASKGHLYSVFSMDVSYAIAAFALILGLALAPTNTLARVLSHPWLVLLGGASFALYLIHKPLQRALGSGAWSTGITPWTLGLEIGILAIVASLAIVLHLYFERPTQRFVKAKLARRSRSAQC